MIRKRKGWKGELRMEGKGIEGKEKEWKGMEEKGKER